MTTHRCNQCGDEIHQESKPDLYCNQLGCDGIYGEVAELESVEPVEDSKEEGLKETVVELRKKVASSFQLPPKFVQTGFTKNNKSSTESAPLVPHGKIMTDNSECYDSIRPALNNADSRIYLGKGVYKEDIILNNGKIIQGNYKNSILTGRIILKDGIITGTVLLIKPNENYNSIFHFGNSVGCLDKHKGLMCGGVCTENVLKEVDELPDEQNLEEWVNKHNLEFGK